MAKNAETGGAPGAPMQEDARRQRLAEASAGAEPVFYTPLPDGLRKLPVVTVPADLPVYRFDNGRLIAELHEHVHETGADFDRLRAAAETAESQALLHRLLMSHATDKRGPILQELRRLRQQTEPLLVTETGVVVNGNRRLAAMRSLLAEDPQTYACYGDVSVAVLPAGTSAADIDFVEAALQMVPETKLGYNWINRRLKLHRQIETLKLPREWVLAAYQIEDPAQLQAELAQLELAQAYLRDRLGQPEHFAAIEDAEALFVALQAQLDALPPRLRPVWQSIGFAMIEARAALGPSLHGVFPFEPAQPKQLPTLALRRFALEKLHAEEAHLDKAGPEANAMLDDLRTFFDGCKPDDKQALKDLIEVMEAVQEEQREAARPVMMMRRIRGLRSIMDGLSPERLNTEQRNALRSEVAAIDAQARYLLGEAAEHRFEQSKTTMVKAVSRYLHRWRQARGNAEREPAGEQRGKRDRAD